MKILFFFNKNLVDLKHKEYYFLLTIFQLLIILISIIFSYYFYQQFQYMFEKGTYNILPGKLPFGYGDLLKNMFDNNIYANKEVFLSFNKDGSSNIHEINFVLKKLPFFSLLLYLILNISKNIYFVVILKNLIFFNLFFITSYITIKSLRLKLSHHLIIILFFLLVPFNIKTFSEISYGDSVSSIMLGCLYLILISKLKNKYFYTGIILSVLYLTKESMFIICVMIPFLIVFLNFNQDRIKTLIPIIFVIFSALSWGFFGLYKTGEFPFGSSISTWKSYDLSKSIDEDFKLYYPKNSTDNLDKNIITEKLSNEWEFYHYFQEKNYKQIISKPKIVYENFLLKIKFILFNLSPDGISYEKTINAKSMFILTSLLNKLFFYLGIILSLIFLIKKNFKFKHETMYFLGLVTLNLATHLIGWMTSKHFVGIALVSFIFVVLIGSNFFLNEKKKYKKVAL